MTWVCVGTDIERTAVSGGCAAGNASWRLQSPAWHSGTVATADRVDRRCGGALPAAQPLPVGAQPLAAVRGASGVVAFAAEGPSGRARQAPAAGVARLGASAGRARAAVGGGTGAAAHLGAPKRHAALEAHGQVGVGYHAGRGIVLHTAPSCRSLYCGISCPSACAMQCPLGA